LRLWSATHAALQLLPAGGVARRRSLVARLSCALRFDRHFGLWIARILPDPVQLAGACDAIERQIIALEVNLNG
jgi:hypothetical protein